VEEVILFDWWRTESCFGLTFSCLLVFLMAAGYEALKWFRVYFQMWSTCHSSEGSKGTISVSLKGLTHRHGAEDALIDPKSQAGNDVESPPVANEKGVELSTEQIYAPTVVQDPSKGKPKCQWLMGWLASGGQSAFAPARLVEMALYCLQLTLAYWLMLIAMTYNTYLTAAVVLGAGFGHWLFAGLKCASNPLAQANYFAEDACH